MRFRRDNKRSAPSETPAADDSIRDAWITAGMEASGTCVACLRETDTGTGFVGPAAFAVAGLMVVGVEQPVAVKMVSMYCEYELGCPPATVPNEEITYRVRLCSACRRPFPGGPNRGRCSASGGTRA